MAKRRSFLLIAIALTILATFWIKRQGPRTPAGQPALVELEHSGIDELKDAFNAAVGQTRLLVMLSPT